MSRLNSFVKYKQKKCADKKIQKYNVVYRHESENRMVRLMRNMLEIQKGVDMKM